MRVLAWAGAVAAALSLSSSHRLSADDKFDAAALYEKCVRSCAFLVTPHKGGDLMGSGSLIDTESRYVITNYHIVGDADSVFVQFPVPDKDGTLMAEKKKYLDRIKAGDAPKGKVLYRDKARDLAVVQLDKLPPDTPALPLAKESIRVGEKVIRIGDTVSVDSAFGGYEHTVRAVRVMNLVGGGGDEVLLIKAKVIELNAIGSVAGSGGPVIDREGRLVGVEANGRVGVQNFDGAIDVTEIRAFLKENKVAIKEPGRVNPAGPWPWPGPDLRPPLNPQRGPRDLKPIPDPALDGPPRARPGGRRGRASPPNCWPGPSCLPKGRTTSPPTRPS